LALELHKKVNILYQKIKLFLFTVCIALGTQANAQSQVPIGISMPEFSNMRWVNDGLSIMRELNKFNLASDLKYASGGPEMQVAQIEGMIQNGAKVLIIAASDGKKLR
jgi:putative multiple sugar transport system substrate-binding protein